MTDSIRKKSNDKGKPTPLLQRKALLPSPGLVAVLVLTLFVTIPLLSRAGLPIGDDIWIHSYRAAEMQRSWEHGLIFPSWAEGIYLGYGSPVFHFYASLTYYILSLLRIIFDLTLLDALRSLLVLCFLACSSGMFLFVRRRSGVPGAVLAGLLYAYSPYLLVTEAYARGAYPELIAFTIFPWLLWRLDALRDKPAPLNFVWVVLLQVALINSHNLMALILTAIAFSQLIFETLIQRLKRERGRQHRLPSTMAILALVLGVGASATFWLPVLLERDSVPLENLTAVSFLHYSNHFVPLGRLLAAPPILDSGALGGLENLLFLGIAQWTLALSGLVATLLFCRRFRPHHPQTLAGILFFTLLACLLIALTVPSSKGLWDRLRPMQFLQFPWRLLGPAAACLAIVAGANGLWLERLGPRWQSGLIALLIALPIVTSIPLFFIPEAFISTLDTSLSSMHADGQENPGRASTTATNEFLPRAVHIIPDPSPDLLADYADGYPVDKLNRSNLPPTTKAELLHNSPQASEWRINASADIIAEIYNFHWYGWRAELDGETVAIRPSIPDGLITVAVPAGDHHLRVYLGSTPERDLAAQVSLLSLLLVAGVALGLRRRQPVSNPHQGILPLTPNGVAGILLGAALALLSVLLFFREGIAWIKSPLGEALSAQVQRKYTLGAHLQLLGHDLYSNKLQAGEPLFLRLYWYAPGQNEFDYYIFIHLSTGGPPLAQIDRQHLTTKWLPSGHNLYDYVLYLPTDIPSGDYQLIVGMYTCELFPPGECGNGYRLPVADETGTYIGDSVPLATIRVVSRK